MGDKDNYKLIANNKKAYFDYFIEDTWEAGIALHGTEVKSVRMGKCSIKEAFIRVEDGEVFVYNTFIFDGCKYLRCSGEKNYSVLHFY